MYVKVSCNMIMYCKKEACSQRLISVLKCTFSICHLSVSHNAHQFSVFTFPDKRAYALLQMLQVLRVCLLNVQFHCNIVPQFQAHR